MIVCCLEDQVPTQEIMSQLLKEHDPNSEIHIFSASSEALQFLESHHVDLIVSDLDITGRKELAVIEYSKNNNIPCIVYSAHCNQRFVNVAFEYGANAFVSKLESLDKFRHSIQHWQQVSAVHGTHSPIDDHDNFQKLELTNNEVDILKLIIKGLSRNDIGSKLGFSANTINTYLRDMCKRHECKKEELICRYLYWNDMS